MAAPLAERIDSLASASTCASARCRTAHEHSLRTVSPVVLLLLRPRSALRCSHRKNNTTETPMAPIPHSSRYSPANSTHSSGTSPNASASGTVAHPVQHDNSGGLKND